MKALRTLNVNAYARTDESRGAEPTVQVSWLPVGEVGGSVTWHFSPDEARWLSAMLQIAADKAEQAEAQPTQAVWRSRDHQEGGVL